MLIRLYDTHVRRRKNWRHFDEMASFSGDSRELTAGRLASLLRHAARTVPFYRGKISSSLGDGEAFQALASLPVVGKRELNSSPELFLSSEPGRGIFSNFTSGSSGQFLEVLQDGEYFDWAMAGKYLFYTWAGWKPGDRILKLWNSQRDLQGIAAGFKSRIGYRLRDMRLLDSKKISPETMEKYADAVRSWRPAVVEAAVEAALPLSRAMTARGVSPAASLRGVITSTGTLFPEFEEEIRRAFGVPVTNRYGCREAGDMACTCPAGRIHVNPFTHFLEVLDERGNPVAEGTGRVAVTLLTNYTMPLIRYDIQDMATVGREPSPCPCGRNWQTLERVEGRIGSMFCRQDGTLLHPLFFVRSLHMADREHIVERYQVVQEDYGRFTVRLVFSAGIPEDGARARLVMSAAEKEIRRLVEDPLEIGFHVAGEIPPLPSGKYLYALSRVCQESLLLPWSEKE